MGRKRTVNSSLLFSISHAGHTFLSRTRSALPQLIKAVAFLHFAVPATASPVRRVLLPRDEIVPADEGRSAYGISVVGLWALIVAAVLVVILLIFVGICWWRYDWRPINRFVPYRVVVRSRPVALDPNGGPPRPLPPRTPPSPPQTSEGNPASLFYRRDRRSNVPNQNPPMMEDDNPEEAGVEGRDFRRSFPPPIRPPMPPLPPLPSLPRVSVITSFITQSPLLRRQQAAPAPEPEMKQVTQRPSSPMFPPSAVVRPLGTERRSLPPPAPAPAGPPVLPPIRSINDQR